MPACKVFITQYPEGKRERRLLALIISPVLKYDRIISCQSPPDNDMS